MNELSESEWQQVHRESIEKNKIRCFGAAWILAIYEPISLISQMFGEKEFQSPFYLFPTVLLCIVAVLYLMVYIMDQQRYSMRQWNILVHLFYFVMMLSMSCMIIADWQIETQIYLNFILTLSVMSTLPILRFRYTFILCVIPFCVNTVMSVLCVHYVAPDSAFLLALALFCGYATSKSQVFLIARDLQSRTTNEILERQLTKQLEHYRQLEYSQKETRAIRHDMKNHMLTISGFVAEDRKSEALEYMQDIVDDINQTKPVIQTGNEVIDAILSAKKGIADQKKIDYNMQVAFLVKIEINPIDLSIILGNLLDNAIEACNQMTGERFVNVTLGTKGGLMFGEIENSCVPMDDVDGSIFQSTKPGKGRHGFGLINVKKALARHEGDISFKEHEGKFTANFILDNSRVKKEAD